MEIKQNIASLPCFAFFLQDDDLGSKEQGANVEAVKKKLKKEEVEPKSESQKATQPNLEREISKEDLKKSKR